MRNTRLVVLVVAALASAASFAGAQGTPPSSARAARTRNGIEQRTRGELLRGVKLTDAEKGKLKEIRGRYQADAKSLRESLKPAVQEARVARQKGDTAAARAVFERTKSDHEKLSAVVQRQRTDLRAALTAEHQKQFDANVQQVVERRARTKRDRGGKGHLGGRQQKTRPAANG